MTNREMSVTGGLRFKSVGITAEKNQQERQTDRVIDRPTSGWMDGDIAKNYFKELGS